jgi:hypothetical protein
MVGCDILSTNLPLEKRNTCITFSQDVIFLLPFASFPFLLLSLKSRCASRGSSGYQQLDECKERPLKKREHFLMVLSHPEILLHNHPAELGARARVRKRDVSVQARTPEGIGTWDTFQTLVGTANKRGVNLFRSLFDRLTHASPLPSLASLIQERASSTDVGISWQPSP